MVETKDIKIKSEKEALLVASRVATIVSKFKITNLNAAWQILRATKRIRLCIRNNSCTSDWFYQILGAQIGCC